MKRTRVDIDEGLTIGDVVYRRVLLREQTLGDLIDAANCATSEYEQGVEVLSRQIEKLEGPAGEEFEGPIPRPVMRKMTAIDSQILSEAVEELQKRGRPGAAGGRKEGTPGRGGAHRD